MSHNSKPMNINVVNQGAGGQPFIHNDPNLNESNQYDYAGEECQVLSGEENMQNVHTGDVMEDEEGEEEGEEQLMDEEEYLA